MNLEILQSLRNTFWYFWSSRISHCPKKCCFLCWPFGNWPNYYRQHYSRLFVKSMETYSQGPPCLKLSARLNVDYFVLIELKVRIEVNLIFWMVKTNIHYFFFSPVVIISLTEGIDGTIPSKILFPFPWIPYLKTDGTSLPILFLVKNFEEKEMEFLKERFCQKLLSNDDNN